MTLIVTPRQLSQRAELYHQLGQLTAAGIALPQAITAQRERPPAAAFRHPLTVVEDRLAEGATFAEAIQRTGNWLPAFDQALLGAGELSGRLPASFKLLSGYYQERAQLVRSLLADLAYPFLVFHLAFLIFPIDRLQQLVLHGDLAGFLAQKMAFFIPGYAGVLLLIWAAQGTRGESWRAAWESLLRPVPLLGTARRSLALARLSAALEALLSAGVPILEAWQLAAAASGSPRLHRRLQRAKPHLEAGTTPAEMVRATPEFPSHFASLYQTGEVSGQLDEALQRLRDLFQEEGSRQLRMALKGISFVVILGVMVAVAWQVIHFWLGYFQQIQQVIPE